MKTCKRCGEEKDVAHFPSDKRRKDGLYPYCRLCHVFTQTGYKAQRTAGELNSHHCPLCLEPVRGHANRRFCSSYCKDRVRDLRAKYDLSPEDFRALLEDCGGRCLICAMKLNSPAIDHNHQTLELTGICCTRCNVGLLAYSGHDPETVSRLLDYLVNPQVARVLGRIPKADPDLASTSSRLHQTWRRKASKAATWKGVRE